MVMVMVMVMVMAIMNELHYAAACFAALATFIAFIMRYRCCTKMAALTSRCFELSINDVERW